MEAFFFIDRHHCTGTVWLHLELRESHRALVRALCAAPILAFPRFDQDASFSS
jgi:hypothetical protein